MGSNRGQYALRCRKFPLETYLATILNMTNRRSNLFLKGVKDKNRNKSDTYIEHTNKKLALSDYSLPFL